MTTYDAESLFDQPVESRERGERPVAPDADLTGADLRGANLTGVNLRGANLGGADLRGADLSDANLRAANLRGADLRGADLTVANLRAANLRGANLTGANLTWANLRAADMTDANLRGANLGGANLSDADLTGANLTGANLRGANLTWAASAARILHLEGLPSGETIFMPTPGGWYLTVGCWEGNLEDLKNLIASDEGWPEARGAEVARRRPLLQAVAALCEAHVGLYPTVIDELAEKWRETDGLGVDRG